MKKFFGYLLVVLILISAVLYFVRDLILKEYLQRKMSQANQAPVKIGYLDLDYIDRYIILKDIKIMSNLHKEEIFISIDELKSYYDIDFSKKIITFDDAEIEGIKFFEEDKFEYSEAEKTLAFTNKVSIAEENFKREKVLSELKELYLNKVEASNLNIKEVLEKSLDTKSLNEENNSEVVKIKESIKNIKESNEKGLKISDVIDEISNIGKNSKKIIKDLDINTLSKDINNNQLEEKSEHITDKLDGFIRDFLNKNRLVLFDLDGYINMYLNLIYEQEIYNLSLKYRDIIDEIRVRKAEDLKFADEDKWELFFNSISITSNVYGINFNGEIKNFSTRLSKIKDNTEFKLFGEKGDTIGEFKGFINFDKEYTESDLNIPEANLKDLGLNTLNSGEGMLSQYILTDGYNLSINGSIYLKNMKLNTENLLESMKIDINDEVVKEILVPLLSELHSGNINYSYNTENRILEIKTNISEVLDSIINGENSSLKRRMKEKIKNDILNKILN